jgi:hypothetical protein
MFDTILDRDSTKDPQAICRENHSPACIDEYIRYKKENT